MSSPQPAPKWMKIVLWLAAVYNISWGAVTIFYPSFFFTFAGMPYTNYPEIWQCVGMIVGVYGVGYAIAASNPYRHWPIIFVGLLGKILGPIGFIAAYYASRFTLKAGMLNVTNDLIWWIPFTIILIKAYKFYKQIS